MYKIYSKKSSVLPGNIPKIFLIMRLTTFLIIVSLMQVSAIGLAQNISLSRTHAPLKSILKELRLQSGYDFVYEEKLLEQAKPVDIQVKGANIEDVLKSIFNKQPLTYIIEEKTVVITRKKAIVLNHANKTSALNPVTKTTVFEQANTTVNVADINIHGKVLDDQGNAMAYVTVSVKGTHRKTSTNKDGEFFISVVNASDVLVFTSVGMETSEVNLNNRKEITVTLRSVSHTLAEVRISTGYQTIKKEQMTGSTVTVGSPELEQRYQPNINDKLEGRVPGLVNYRGTTEIRGVSTLQSSTAILYVVDGLPIEGSIANINPYDVESITVLKDAAAAAIYGARASNGVIVVTTKRAKEKGTVVEFSSDITVTDKPDIDFKLLTSAQTVDLESSFWKYNYSGIATSVATAISTTTNNINLGNSVTPVNYLYYQLAQGTITQNQLQSQLDALKQNNFRQQYKDNALLRDILQQYNLSIRTNTEKLQSSIVVNYKADNTDIIDGYNRQLNLFYKGTYYAAKWLNVNYGINTVLGIANANNSSFATNPANEPAYQQLLDGNGNRVQYTTADFNMYNTVPQTTPQLQSLRVNHLDELPLDRIKTNTTNTRYYVNMDVKLLPGLIFNPYFQYESNETNTSAYSEQQSYTMRLLNDLYTSRTGTSPNYTYSYLLPTNGGKLATTQTNGSYWTARGQLNYLRDLGKHSINIIAGTEFRQTNVSGTKGLLLGYDDQLQSQSTASVNFNALSLLTVPTLVKTGSSLANTYAALANSIGVIPEATHRYGSAYANATYTYDRRFTAFGSFRKDYADVFGLDPKFRGKPLWSIGSGWDIQNESFMRDVHWVGFLKLRASYGLTGNINTNATSYLTATTGTTNALTQLPIATITNPANPYLRWEKTSTFNLGLDFTLFSSRLNGSLDWYHKKSTDLFANTLLDPASGFSNYMVNNGGLVNNGLELSVNYAWFNPAKRGGFGWSTLLVVSHNNNKITYVDQLATTPIALVQGGYKVGYPVNSQFSLQYKGLNTVGQPQWLKADGTLTTQALVGSDLNTVAYSGQTDPKNNIAVTNIFQYKGFTLNVLIVYYGGQTFRGDVPSVYQASTLAAMPSYLLNSWTPTNTNTNIPGFGQYVPPAAVPAFHLAYSDAFVRPGDFIKIRNAVLGYNLPQQWARKIGSGNINVHFQVNNPKALWMKNNIGIDPETINPVTGVGGVPTPTSYVFGVSFKY